MTNKIGTYASGAKKRGLEWSLTREECESLLTGDCHYCGAPPSATQGAKFLNPVVSNGIDRIDSRLGYFADNCVSCCKVCNVAKNNHEVNDFLSWADRVSRTTALRSIMATELGSAMDNTMKWSVM